MQSRHTARSVIVYGFLTVILILIAITALGLTRIYHLTAGLNNIVKERDEQVMHMHSMRHAALERSILLQSMMITHDPFTFDDYVIEMSLQAGAYFQAQQELLQHKLSDSERALLDQQHAMTMSTGSTQNHIIELLNAQQPEEAARQLHDLALPGQHKAMAMMDQFIAQKRQQNITALEQTAQDINFTYGLMLTLSTFGVLFSLGIAYFISNRINAEISKRLASETGLRHSELRERTIRENIIDGILTVDANGVILTCNRACTTIFGHDPQEMVGKSAHMLLPNAFCERQPLDLSRHLVAWEKKLLGTGREVTARSKDQREFPAELDVSRVVLDGEATYIVVVRDITGKKEAARRLQQFNRELETMVEQRTSELATTNEALRSEIEERIRTQDELSHLARHDSLTELPNRAFFTEQLTSTLFHAARRQNLLAQIGRAHV